MTPSRQLTCLLILISASTASAQNWPGIKDSIYSNAIGETRKIQVILPKDYKQGSEKTYEVLYMPDGEWYMEQVPFIYNFVMSSHFGPPNIFVLIPNTYVNGENIRSRDYSPTKIPQDSISGGADNYHRFLKEELIPYIEKKYPANGQRTLVGSSFSGLFAIYAFFKDPALFNSYVASDPSLSFDDNYVPRMAAEKLPQFGGVGSTLFFAGLKTTSRGMGISALDSIMKRSAPGSLRWKYIEYADETHYSVQHKAFYDGFRFSHLGYSDEPFVIHPMAGTLTRGKGIKLAVLNNPVNVKFTTDGSVPVPESPSLEMGVVVPGPCVLKATAFANRPADARALSLDFAAATTAAQKSTKRATETSYAVYEGAWSALPDTRKLKPASKGILTKDMQLNQKKSKADAAYVVEGTLTVDEAGYYIFASFGPHAAKVTLGNLTFLNTPEFDQQATRSYVTPLEKGIYPIRVELLQKATSPDFAFSVFKSTSPEQTWWQQRVFGF